MTPERDPTAPFLAGMPGFLLSLLVPGAGFFLCGRRARGTLNFLLVVVTFGLGLALHGGVQMPIWKVKHEEFNLINNIAFVVQLLAGLPALASFLANQAGPPEALGWLAGKPVHAYHELGGYFLIVAGALNYFAATNFLDRIGAPHRLLEEQELNPREDETL